MLQSYGSSIFSIKKSIIEGPLSIPINVPSTWKYEIEVMNIGRGRICNVVLANIINLNTITEANILLTSKGTALFFDTNILWSVGDLKIGERVVLQVEVTGSFEAIGEFHLSEANVLGLDPILETIIGEPVTGSNITILPA